MKLHQIGTGLLIAAVLASMVALTGCPKPREDPGMMVDAQPPVEDVAAGGESGTINQIGSTTVLPIAEAWAGPFREANPGVQLNVSGGGSGAGIEGLINGTADIANSSREIKDKEVEQATAAGITPVEHTVAYDGIAVVVHPSNPVEALSLEQISDIYVGNVTKWSELGVEGAGDIVAVSRDSSSGTYESFKEMAVQMHGKDKDRDYGATILKQASNEAVKNTVASGTGAIGYIGLGYVDESVKVIGVIGMDGGEPVMPSAETVKDKSYPIARALYMYTAGEPTGAIKAYLDWGLGAEGQKLVAEEGFIPVN